VETTRECWARLQYRERSDRMALSIVILTIALLSAASGRIARGTVSEWLAVPHISIFAESMISPSSTWR